MMMLLLLLLLLWAWGAAAGRRNDAIRCEFMIEAARKK